MRQTFKKVQVVYYLSRNGLLEHPHYMELTLTPHHHPTLKDVMDRLTVLRGKAMPSLYSWSCKRSYKNGYVWNDLAENDVIFPSEGGEYVLKGSEIVFSCTDRLQRFQLNQDSNLHQKRELLSPKRHPEPPKIPSSQYEEEEEEKEPQTCKSCSIGVSTDEIEEFDHQTAQKVAQIQQTPDANSPPPSAGSDNSPNTLDATIANIPTRFEDGDPVGIEPMLSRNSMLLSLIACGGSSSFRRSLPPAGVKESRARKSCSGAGEEEDEIMIKYMSENPRLIGKLQAEDKEYFSGSIVEAMGDEERLGGGDQRPGLKRSSSFNQERSGKTEAEVEVKTEKVKMKGKCLPRKKAAALSKGLHSKHLGKINACI